MGPKVTNNNRPTGGIISHNIERASFLLPIKIITYFLLCMTENNIAGQRLEVIMSMKYIFSANLIAVFA